MPHTITPVDDKVRFLVALSKQPNRLQAANSVGLSAETVMRWLRDDKQFDRDLAEIESGNPRADLYYSLKIHELQEAMKLVGINRVEVRV